MSCAGSNVGPANKLMGLNSIHYFRKGEITLTKDSSQETDRTTKKPYFGWFQELPEIEVMYTLFCAGVGNSELLGSVVTKVLWVLTRWKRGCTVVSPLPELPLWEIIRCCSKA